MVKVGGEGDKSPFFGQLKAFLIMRLRIELRKGKFTQNRFFPFRVGGDGPRDPKVPRGDHPKPKLGWKVGEIARTGKKVPSSGRFRAFVPWLI